MEVTVPNPNAISDVDDQESDSAEVQRGIREILNPFLDKGGAAFGAVIITTTLVTILTLNAASAGTGEHAVVYVTLPAAFVMLCWDLASGWHYRHTTRGIARDRQREQEVLEKTFEEVQRQEKEKQEAAAKEVQQNKASFENMPLQMSPPKELSSQDDIPAGFSSSSTADDSISTIPTSLSFHPPFQSMSGVLDNANGTNPVSNQPSSSLVSNAATSDNHHLQNQQLPNNGVKLKQEEQDMVHPDCTIPSQWSIDTKSKAEMELHIEDLNPGQLDLHERRTLVSLIKIAYRWSQETFPTPTEVLRHLPFALVPFALSMFVLVQALVTKGWVQVFAHGWDRWVNKTGTLGSIGGMGFLSVILCNVSFYSRISLNELN